MTVAISTRDPEAVLSQVKSDHIWVLELLQGAHIDARERYAPPMRPSIAAVMVAALAACSGPAASQPDTERDDTPPTTTSDATTSDATTSVTKPANPAPEFEGVVTAGGDDVTLESYRGNLVVITFGASWCEPCKKELPAWEKLAKRYQDEGVVFIAVNTDEDEGAGKRFMNRANLEVMHAVFDSSGATVEKYDPAKMPTTFVIGPNGSIQHVHHEYHPGDEDDLAKVLDSLLP
jgi:peroxiredoxin